MGRIKVGIIIGPRVDLNHTVALDYVITQLTENLIIVVSAGVIGVITLDGELNSSDLPLSVFLILLGFFGAAFTAKHYERYRMHDARLKEIRDKLDRLLPNLKMKKLRRTAIKKHKARFPVLSRLRLTHFWIAIHLLIELLGIVISILSALVISGACSDVSG